MRDKRRIDAPKSKRPGRKAAREVEETFFRGVPRADAIVAGNKYVVAVERALISTGTPRSVVSSEVADKVSSQRGRVECVDLPGSAKRACGQTVPIAIALDGCRAADVRAVVTGCPGVGVDLVIGNDVLRRAEANVEFKRRQRVTCRRTDR